MGRPAKVRELGPRLRQILRRFWPYTRGHRLVLSGALLALVAQVLLRLLEPWMLAVVLDHVIAPKVDGASSSSFLAGIDPALLLTLASVGLVLTIGLRALVVYVSRVGFALVGNRVLTQIRADMHRHLHRLPLSFHTGSKGGDLTVRLIGDIGLLKDVLVSAALPLLGNTFILLGMVGVLFWLHWQLAVLALVTIPLFWLSTIRLTDKIHKVSRDQRAREGSMASSSAESLGAIQVVQALGLEDTFSRSFSRLNRKSMKEGVKGTRLAARLERSVDVLVALSTGLVLYFGAQFVLRGELSPGELVVFLTYLKNALKPVRDFAKYTARLAKATAAGERVLDVFERDPEIRDHPDAVPAPALEGRVGFDEVTFGYDPDRPVLQGVTFTAEPGECVALVGSSGNGKSTLVNLILRLYDVDEGRILLDGRDLRELTLGSVRSQVAVVLQDTVLFAASVEDNIRYGNPAATREEVEQAARLANAHDFIQALPRGYDTVLGERGVTLSGGQRQRIAIARAAIRQASILILDEPTTGLDEENARQVTEALERLTHGHTTFLVTHDLRQVAGADRILFIEEGRVLEQGSHEELLRAGGRYAELCRIGDGPRLRLLRATGGASYAPRHRGVEPPLAPEGSREFRPDEELSRRAP